MIMIRQYSGDCQFFIWFSNTGSNLFDTLRVVQVSEPETDPVFKPSQKEHL